MKLHPVLLLTLLSPLPALSQHKLSFGGEMTGVHKKSSNISPFDAYQLFGPIAQWSHKRDSSKVQVNVQTGFLWVRSSAYSHVFGIPLNAGIDYRFSSEIVYVYGLTAAAGTRLMFSDNTGIRLLPGLRIGIYYDLFKGVPLKVGYERIGNSNGIFAQLIIYSFPLSHIE